MIFTSEQVSNGHPDKICDQISDKIVTECLKQDKGSRCAVETMIKDFYIFIVGELTTNAKVDFEKCAREVLVDIGLDDIDKYIIETHISAQSADIALGTNDDVGGAGDQGIMFGYATNETPEMMPLPYVMATKALIKLRAKNYPFLKADAKSQVSYDYDKNRIDTFLISCQHTEEATNEEIYNAIHGVMLEVANEYSQNTDFRVLINPTGRFVVGSSFGDSGLTGRKIIADTYGGAAHHGGGAFSGKDASKVDRSAAYMCRYVARQIVKNDMAEKAEIQVGYAIGVPEPVSINVNTFGTGKISEKEIESYVRNNFDFTPKGMTKFLKLTEVNYYKLTASYGHFGKTELPWEQ